MNVKSGDKSKIVTPKGLVQLCVYVTREQKDKLIWAATRGNCSMNDVIREKLDELP